MAEAEYELVPILIEYIRDECGKGSLMYSHTEDTYQGEIAYFWCDVCNKHHYLDTDRKYPCREFRKNSEHPIKVAEAVPMTEGDRYCEFGGGCCHKCNKRFKRGLSTHVATCYAGTSTLMPEPGRSSSRHGDAT